jgi:tellurite resistance protein
MAVDKLKAPHQFYHWIHVCLKENKVGEKDQKSVLGSHTEEKYFREKEKELIAKLKAKAAKESARKALSEAVGVSDEGILHTLEDMGYDREVVMVLHLVPLLAVAWADGRISDEERTKIVEAARSWGVRQGTAADRKLHHWLSARPEDVQISRALKVIRDIMQFRGAGKQASYRSSVLELAEAVADASGGLLGLGRKISAAERKVIERVARELSDNHPAAAREVLANT